MGNYGQIDYTLGDEYLWKEEGKGFSVNDVVNMKVHLETGKIRWMVNGKEAACLQSPFLMSKKTFVAYVELRNTGDIVEIWN